VAIAGTVTGISTALTFSRLPLLTGGALITAQGKPATTTKIQPGAVIQGMATRTAQGYLLQSADVHYEVEGIIDSVDVAGRRIVILGRIVTMDALTVIEEEGPGDTYTHLTLADLKAGDRVEIYGSPMVEGPVLASRIEREPASSNPEESFHGLVSALDTAAKTFVAGGYTVSYGTAMVTGILANDVKVEIRGTLAGMNLAATSVKVETGRDTTAEASLEACGTISGLDPIAKTFLLMSLKVDYSTAKVEGTLANGVRVEVEGTPGTGGSLVLAARKVEIHRS
jgi:hypothetical protein